MVSRHYKYTIRAQIQEESDTDSLRSGDNITF
mgnify:CR=1 FL=1